MFAPAESAFAAGDATAPSLFDDFSFEIFDMAVLSSVRPYQSPKEPGLTGRAIKESRIRNQCEDAWAFA
jgi:hypothetical protein